MHMRQWIAILCVIGLLLYIGLVMERHQPALRPDTPLAGLSRAMNEAGGHLNAVTVILSVPITDTTLPYRLKGVLAERIKPAALVHQPDPALVTRDGLYYLEMRWRLTDEALRHWPEWYGVLTSALQAEGIMEPAHVQLEGLAAAPRTDLLGLIHRALDSLDAENRQPWAQGPSASVAAKTAALPTGPHAVNVQVAARQLDQQVRLFVAWPAMTGDY